MILFDFMDALYHAMEKKGCEFLYDEYDCAKDYCNTRNAGRPEFVCEITSFTSRNKTVKLGLGILVNGDLLCYFGYFDEQNNLINNEKFMNGSKRINQCVEDAITQVLNVTIRSNSFDSIFYMTIFDSNNQAYEFRPFSENCANLKDNTLLRDEAKRIASEMMYYIKEIKAILEETL